MVSSGDRQLTTEQSERDLDLTSCDKEQIHIPGSVQSHGALILLDKNWQITGASDNAEQFMGIEWSSLVGKNLRTFLSDDDFEGVCKGAENSFDTPMTPIRIHLKGMADFSPTFDAHISHSDANTILEIENCAHDTQLTFADFYRQSRVSINDVIRAKSVDEMFNRLAIEVRNLSGYDRVMVYRFDADGDGTVVSEARADFMESYLHLRFPGTDIPKQARELYVKNLTRLIGNVEDPQSKVLFKDDDRPIDLSYSVLRSVSPIHIQYLKNMGVTSSFSVSIVQDNKLWGLVACHHNTPRVIDVHVRTMCESLGQIASSRLINLSRSDLLEKSVALKKTSESLIQQMTLEANFLDGLFKCPISLLNATNAVGSVLTSDQNQWRAVGITPDEQTIHELLSWLKMKKTDFFVCSDLPSQFENENLGVICGLIAVRIPATLNQWLLWFRSEVLREVSWAGAPQKTATSLTTSEALSPRASFDAWQQQVVGNSLAWEEAEILNAQDFARQLADFLIFVDRIKSVQAFRDVSDLLEEQKKFAKVARETAIGVLELKSSFVANLSHEIRTPMAGVVGLAELMYVSVTEPEQKEIANQLYTSAKHLVRIINDLLNFSQLEADSLQIVSVPVNLREVINLVALEFRELAESKSLTLKVAVDENLPALVYSDNIRLQEILQNFTSNAVKFSTRGTIVIGATLVNTNAQGHVIRLFVTDNGCGIAREDYLNVFEPFVQLAHTDTKTHRGNGLGLSICKKLVELLNGKIGLNSQPGVGSEFFADLVFEPVS